jgi:hypothetical protein
MFKYQITLYCITNQYKPISTIITTDKEIDLNDKKERMEVVNKGIVKICQKKYWTTRELKKYFYTKTKVRKYEKSIDK